MKFAECFVTIKSISNETKYECFVNDNYNSSRISYGNVDLRFLISNKETYFTDVKCEFTEFGYQHNYGNSFLGRLIRFIFEKRFYESKKYLDYSRTGYIKIWNYKDGVNKIYKCEISTPLSFELSIQIKELIELNKNLILHLSGKYFEEDELSEQSKKSQHFIFETLNFTI